MNPSPIFSHALQGDFNVLITHQVGKLLSPLYQENGVVGDEVVESQGFQLARSINPIKINMIKRDLGTAVFVDQGEGWTGDLLRLGSLESLGDALDQGGLAGAEVASQHYQPGWRKHFSQRAAEGNGLFSGMGDEFLFRHAGQNRATSIAILFLGRTRWG